MVALPGLAVPFLFVKTAGAVFLALALLVVVGSWIIPVDTTVFGQSVSCGLPILNTDGTVRDSTGGHVVVEGCKSGNRQRIAIGLVLGLIAAVSGYVMLRSAERETATASAAQPVSARSVAGGAGRFLLRLAIVVSVLVVVVWLFVGLSG